MKNLLKLTLGLLVCVSLFSCDKEDEPAGTSNTLKMDDQAFNASMAMMEENLNTVDNKYFTSLTLVEVGENKSTTLTIFVEYGAEESIEGIYSLTADEATGLSVHTNYMALDGMNTPVTADIETGNVTVAHDGGTKYTLEIDITMTDGVEFSGNYSGDFGFDFE